VRELEQVVVAQALNRPDRADHPAVVRSEPPPAARDQPVTHPVQLDLDQAAVVSLLLDELEVRPRVHVQASGTGRGRLEPALRVEREQVAAKDADK
jgi:hypothetical protein